MGTLDPTTRTWVSSARLASLVGLLLVVAGCGGHATAAPDVQRSVPPADADATATAEVTPTEAAISSQASPQRKPAATAIEAAQAFADALVSGDLTALTLSFAPAGLMQARALAEQSASDGPRIGSASIHSSEEIGGQPPAWSITFVVLTEAGVESYFGTRWQAFPDVGWRIVSLDTGD